MEAKIKNNERVLLLGHFPKGEPTGASMGYELLIDGFKRKGYAFASVDLSLGGHAKKVGALSIRRSWYSLLIIVSAWLKIPRVNTIYMTISNSLLGFVRDFFIIWAGIISKKRIVLHLKGGGYREFYDNQPILCQRIIKSTLARSTHIIVLGELLREQFAFVPGIQKKVKVIPNGLPKALTPPHDHKPKTLPARGEPVRLLYLSNMHPAKGYMDLLGACALLKNESFSNFRCDFCGAFMQTISQNYTLTLKEQKEEFFKRISALNLADHVSYEGVVDGERKEKLLRQAHIFILPTYHPWEGQPISIIEALAYSTPIISTRLNGIPEQLIDGYNGIFVPPQNPVDIAKAIKLIISNRSKYAEMSCNARKHFEENFTSEVHLNRLIGVIRDTF
jgi:glycosyltransferase involved in cell wall biosynthesis